MKEMLADYLRNEFDKAIDGMRDDSLPPHERMYYMSATFGSLSRVFNLEYDSNLVFAHQILNLCHQAILQLINRRASGVDSSIRFHPKTIDAVAHLLDDLKLEILNSKPRYETLSKIAEISYALTGNGHYLHRQGILGNWKSNLLTFYKDPE